jgi:hypothetical protein
LWQTRPDRYTELIVGFNERDEFGVPPGSAR